MISEYTSTPQEFKATVILQSQKHAEIFRHEWEGLINHHEGR